MALLGTREPVPVRVPGLQPLAALAALAILAAGCDPSRQPHGGAGAELGADAAAAAHATAGAGSDAFRPDDAGGADGARPTVEPLDERAARATTGLDPDLLAEALARAAELPRLHNVIVARHGRVEAERHLRGPGPARPVNVKSVSKSILSALVGIAVAEGFLEGIDQPVAPYFATHLGPDPEPARAAITLGDLLSMRSGLESTSSRNYGLWVDSRDWVRHAITRPLVAEPGTRMIYSTGNSHLVSALLTQATGRSTHAFARDRLAAPLGISLPPWPRDPQGIFFGGNDMLVSPRDLLRFGELYRNGGAHDGRQIVPREWVEESWRVRARSSWNRRHLYGLGWWGRDSNGYQVRFAWGYGGQFLFIVPALELTVVFTSDPASPREGPHNRALHALLDDLLVPAAIAGAAPGAASGGGAASDSAAP